MQLRQALMEVAALMALEDVSVQSLATVIETDMALAAAVAVFALNILWTLRLDGAPQPVWDAVWQVPRFVLRQVAGLLRMGNPNKNFKHTEHRKFVSVDEVVGRTMKDKL